MLLYFAYIPENFRKPVAFGYIRKNTSVKNTFPFMLKIVILIFAVIGVFFTGVFVAMHFELLNVPGTIGERNAFFLDNPKTAAAVGVEICKNGNNTCEWNETPEWMVVHDGLIKDSEILNRVSKETGVPERNIAAVVTPEQIRFFTSNREVFKRYFEPLKILGSLTQFSLGVSGIKEDTARQIELFANMPGSPRYPGEEIASLLAYQPGQDAGKERSVRLGNAKDHYYSYLYTAVFIKEVEAEWKNAGFDISQKPEIIATIFNLGFNGSHPNTDPKVGGTIITTGGKSYSFGGLGGLFYNSSELLAEFPKN